MGQSQPITKVLVVEDDAVSHCIVTSSLRRRGFDVVSANDAETAIRIMEKNRDIALVFSDVMMPGAMDGCMLQNWIRVNRPGLPVILGSADPEKAQPTGHEEFRFFAKPYNIDVIAACIRSLTSSGRADGLKPVTDIDYHERAIEARNRARATPSDELRTRWFDVAQAWLLMASDSERRSLSRPARSSNR